MLLLLFSGQSGPVVVPDVAVIRVRDVMVTPASVQLVSVIAAGARSVSVQASTIREVEVT